MSLDFHIFVIPVQRTEPAASRPAPTPGVSPPPRPPSNSRVEFIIVVFKEAMSRLAQWASHDTGPASKNRVDPISRVGAAALGPPPVRGPDGLSRGNTPPPNVSAPTPPHPSHHPQSGSGGGSHSDSVDGKKADKTKETDQDENPIPPPAEKNEEE